MLLSSGWGKETVDNFGSALTSQALNKALDSAIGRDRACTRIFPKRVKPRSAFDTCHELELVTNVNKSSSHKHYLLELGLFTALTMTLSFERK